MAWIPPGTLRAGTPKGQAPRIADEEMPGTQVPMDGFYIDLLPYPNEPGAIPTSNVSRDEAEQLCVARGKRLCTELEWERACKGPENTMHEYGDVYRESACATGVASDQAARRPSGEHAQCKSAFGVADMHGIVWEWTSSPWGRAAKDANLGVLRGGNSAAGELVARCANGIGRPPSKKAPTMGLRCCAGPKNAAEVTLSMKGTPGLSRIADPASLTQTWEAAAGADGVAKRFVKAWTWVPVVNEELVLALACAKGGACSLIVGRIVDDAPTVVATIDAGREAPLPDIARLGDVRHLRLKATGPRGGIVMREIQYLYGRIETKG
jgi:hypothetical protein